MATTSPALKIRKHPLLVRPFALTGLLLGLTGSTLGAVLLLRIQRRPRNSARKQPTTPARLR